MARRTKEELRVIKNEKRIDELIQSNKFLNNPKYYPNNYWSWAAWDSWAAQGKAGSCGCGCGYYNAGLGNKRRKTQKGGRVDSCKRVIERLCSDCVILIEKKLNITFKRRH